MKNEFIANSCRVCLTETKKLRSLYKPIDEGDEPPNKMLHLITGIDVEKLDEHETLPKKICKNCELSLSMAYEFRENALKTQQIIASYIKELYDNDNNEANKSSMSMYKSEYADIMNLEPLKYVDSLEGNIQNPNTDHKYSLENYEEINEDEGDNFEANNDSVDNDIYNQEEMSFQINYSEENVKENINRNYFDRQQDHEQDNEEHESRMWDDQEEFEYKVEQVEFLSADEENHIFTQKKNPRSKIKKPNKKKISKTSTKHDKAKEKLNDIYLPENIKLFSRRGRKPSNTNQNRHICDICGNVFAKRGSMMEHRQRHDKECRFCCEICDKKFLTRELLRKHMFSHSGGKPLKCGFCSRTFYYESVRKAHEAVHKGLRPYICDDCGKCFSYPHALKKHKLIHAEIKLYRCEYCHKDFRLQHHIKQHELTKLHQNTVLFAQSGSSSYEDCNEVMKRGQLEDIFIEEIAEDQINGSS